MSGGQRRSGGQGKGGGEGGKSGRGVEDLLKQEEKNLLKNLFNKGGDVGRFLVNFVEDFPE